MIIETLSTFPCMYDSVMNSSMMRIAQEKGILDFHAYDLRDWTHDRHRTTDDDPYGGGAGMVIEAEPVFRAIKEAKKRTGEEVCCSEGEEVSEAIDIDWAEYMVCARKMGMSEDEFWNSDPVFFNECLEVFTELEKRKRGALIG